VQRVPQPPADYRHTEGMQHGFVHEVVLAMDPGADIRAPGAAITRQLCGHWDHQPPCPLAPHHTDAQRAGAQVHLRVLFVAEQTREAEVRELVDLALASGLLRGPEGVATEWHVVRSGAGDLTPAEHRQVERMADAGRRG
jgi:hypothetical protein